MSGSATRWASPARLLGLGLGLLWAGAGCASFPTPRPAASPAPAWPAPPEAPLARFAGSFPDPDAVPEPAPLLRRAFDLVVGIDPAAVAAGSVLARPFGVVARGDLLHVADPDGHRVLRVDRARGLSDPVVCTDLPWSAPMALVVAADGALFVADGAAGVVVRVEPSGRCTRLGVGVLSRPTGLALLGARLFVVDPPRHSVVELSPEGKEVGRFGTRGDGSGELNFPTSVAAGVDGSLLVVDSLNFRITRFSPDGRVLGSFGEAGDGSGAFGRPKAVAVAGDGRVFVSDSQHDVVLAFAADGSFLCAIGGHGDGPGSLSLPAGLSIDRSTLYVADSFGHRVQIYDLLGGVP